MWSRAWAMAWRLTTSVAVRLVGSGFDGAPLRSSSSAVRIAGFDLTGAGRRLRADERARHLLSCGSVLRYAKPVVEPKIGSGRGGFRTRDLCV